MASGSVDFDASQVLNFLKVVREGLPKAVASTLNVTAGAAERHAKDRHGAGGPGKARFTTRTGNLANSITLKSATPRTLRAQVRSGLVYSAIIEEGYQDTIIIRPKRAKALRFKTKDGRIVFTKRVAKKGQKAYPYMGPAVKHSAPVLEKMIKRNIDQLFARASRG